MFRAQCLGIWDLSAKVSGFSGLGTEVTKAWDPELGWGFRT